MYGLPYWGCTRSLSTAFAPIDPISAWFQLIAALSPPEDHYKQQLNAGTANSIIDLGTSYGDKAMPKPHWSVIDAGFS